MNKPELAHLMNLIALACVDGNVSEEEITIVHSIADSLGATQEEFDFCVEQANEALGKGNAIIEVPDTDEEKTFFLKNLTLMMMADGKLDDEEKRYIKFIAEKFGYDGEKALPILIESVINEFQQAMDKQQGKGPADTHVDGPAGTRETGKKVGMDEEKLKAEIREAVQLGKEALMKHDIRTAFDHLVYAAHLDKNACRLFLMIVNVRARLFKLSKEQVDLLKSFAEQGYALSQYAYGRWLESKRPETDSLDIADEYLKKAEKAGVGDAIYAQAVLLKAGHYGLVDREKFSEMIQTAVDKGSFLAEQYIYRQTIFGWNGVKADPKRIVDGLKNWLNGNESDDILEVNPGYYYVLGDAYAELNDKQNAEHYYRKAINMGYIEAWADLCSLHYDDEDFCDLLDQGCEAGAANCFVVRATRHMDEYDERGMSGDIMEDLLSGYEEGSDMAPYFIGDIYHHGSYGFDKDLVKAWNWYVEGANRDDGDAYLALSLMISNHENPIEIPDEEKTMYHYVMMALRNNANTDILDTVVEGYLDGEFSDYAEEFERYYLPEYYRKHENNEEEEEEDEEEEEEKEHDEEYEYKLIAIVKINGKADIIEFDVEEGWDELPDFISAKRLDAIRTQPLYDISKQEGFGTDHITAWVDNMGLMKDLPMNRIGCKLYPGPIAGDMILTLEDAKYNPKSFHSIAELKKVIAALGAEVDQIMLDDGPDDDGRYDAWA